MNAVRRQNDDELTEVDEKEAWRVQHELLRVLHAEGEARTRREDSPRGKLLDSAVPFVIGILIGALGTYAGISGRLSTLEAVQAQQTAELKESRAAIQEVLTYVRAQQISPPTPVR